MRFLVFDCESIGLHGETFAVGYVIVDNGVISRFSGRFSCLPYAARGDDSSREWVSDHVNVPPSGYNCETPREVRDAFWKVWEEFKAKGDGYLAADVAWPVEARFLANCVDDDSEERAWSGPYPLIDIASVRFAAGFNPLGTFDRLSDEQPEHDPLADARQSARLLTEALRVVEPAWTKPEEVIV